MLDLLQKREYDFIRTNSDLDNIIYLVLSGSHAYGTSVETSDLDLRGALIEPPKYIFGLNGFEQFEDLATDTVIYGLKKFVGLLAKANPNTLELLGVSEDSIVIISEQGRVIRNNAELFLSKRVIHSFGNYAVAQLRRLQNALSKDTYTEEEKRQHLEETLCSQLDHFGRTYQKFPEGSLKLYTNEGALKFDVNLENYPVADFVGIYSELSSIIKTYNKLNHRNNKKSEAGLYKHAMHLIRVLITGTDILNGKGIITNRKAEHSLLMDIRNAKLSFDEIWQLTNESRAEFKLAADNTKLPDEPYYNDIEEMLIKLYMTFKN